jgi:prepilin-type N-terminal cleavage/methylation domain-containing protein
MTKGFTLVELLVVISLVALLGFLSMPLYHSMQGNVALSNYTQQIVSDLRTAQQKSIVSQGGTTHGIYFNSNGYVIFGGDWAAPTYTKNFLINGGIVISHGAGSKIIFERLTGKSTNSEIKIKSLSGGEKIIKVTDLGNISIY